EAGGVEGGGSRGRIACDAVAEIDAGIDARPTPGRHVHRGCLVHGTRINRGRRVCESAHGAWIASELVIQADSNDVVPDCAGVGIVSRKTDQGIVGGIRKTMRNSAEIHVEILDLSGPIPDQPMLKAAPDRPTRSFVAETEQNRWAILLD